MIKREFQSLWKNKLLLIVFIAILLIPAIYAGIFLSSMWDPYGEVEYLPVAVVNHDKSVEYNDSTLSVGKELADNLAENDSMAFNVVDEQTAKTGLENGTYYMVITIPEDFSQNATTLMDDEPKKMVLDYKTNPGKNYVATKMSQSAMKEIKNNITSQVTKTYAENVFNSLQEVGDGFDDAVDGTKEMIDGEDQLTDGNKTITDNLNVLASSSLTFKDGADTLNEGLAQYTSGVSEVDKNLKTVESGLKSVNSGVGQLKSGSSRLLSGLNTMQNTLNKSLTTKNVSNMKAAAAGLTSINNGLQTLNKQVQAGLNDTTLNSLSGMSKNLSGVGDNIIAAGKDLGTESGVGKDLTAAGSNLGTESGVGKNLTDAGTNLAAVGTNLTSAANSLVGDYASTGNPGGALKDVGTSSAILQQLLATDDLSDNQKQLIQTALASNKSAVNNITAAASDISKAGTSANSIKTNIQDAGTNVQKAGANLTSAAANLKSAGTELTAAGKTLSAYSGMDSEKVVAQLKALRTGVATLASSDVQAALTGSNTAINSLLTGMQTVQTALNMTEAKDGTSGLVEGMTALNNGLTTLQKTGTVPLQSGVTKLINQGTKKLVTNNSILLTGMAQLSTGAGQISDGSVKLADGSKTLGEGLTDLTDGTKELSTALADGAKEIRENDASDETLTMFSEPVETEETSITTVKNNGHAMAAYMMSVGLWVGALAFCLMYPLTDYHGKLKSGMAWWASKAVVIYPLAVAMAAVLMAIMHIALGFNPESMPLTFATAAVAAVSFMSIMYFFNALLGKVGSFIMLVFMVIQLAGSAGTYPVEISGPVVPKLHKYVPFTYSVEAFRSSISGGTSIKGYLTVLIVLAVIFSALTIVLFEYRAKRIKEGKPILYTWIEEKGLA
jgi:putative membrane protein